jgi:hypothetical protein
VSELEDLKKAYDVLGLPEDATREQVENRYFILMKRARSGQSLTQANGSESPAPDLTEINRAYNLVLGVETEKISTIKKQTKLAHFFYYYRIHVIVGIIVILVAGYMIKDGIDKRRAAASLPPANLSVSIFGNFYFADVDLLQKNMLKLVPEWKRIDTTLVFVPPEVKSPQDMAMQQKSVLVFMTERSELYITDEKNFKSLAAQGAFIRLDEFEGSESLNVPPDKLLTARADGDTGDHPYGIDVTGNPVFKGIELSGEREIIAIRATKEKWPDTRKLLVKLVQTTP